MKSEHDQTCWDCQSLAASMHQCLASPLEVTGRHGLAHNAPTQTKKTQLSLSDGMYR
jgi:hypothetical protein